MSTINVQCTDQELAITNSPVIASGGANENYIQFSFCSKWDGFAKIAIFYRQGESYYYSLIDENDNCKIPDECLVSSGKIHFGVFGVGATDSSLRRTSEILTYTIVAGVMTEIADPTPEIYQQILSEIQNLRTLVETGGLSDGAVTTTKIADGAVTNVKIANGSVTNEKIDLSAGFSPTGYITLVKNVHYFDSETDLPSAGNVGRVYFVKSE